MEASKETKFGTKVATESRWCPNVRYTHCAEKMCDTILHDEK